MTLNARHSFLPFKEDVPILLFLPLLTIGGLLRQLRETLQTLQAKRHLTNPQQPGILWMVSHTGWFGFGLATARHHQR
jgi:hypothetical protein